VNRSTVGVTPVPRITDVEDEKPVTV